MESEDLLISLLETFGFPVFRQGSLTDDNEYPDTFFTFWNNESYDDSFYDNENNSENSDFDVNIYSNDPSLIYSKLREAKKLLKANGFIVYDSGHDVGSDEPSHVGRGIGIIKNNRI